MSVTPIWQRVECSVCGNPFVDEDDWVSRHDDEDGSDCHELCCPACNPDADE